MSKEITTTAQDAFRELCIRTRVAMYDLAERAKEQRGQTAAEYMGILLIISVIIAALFGAGLGTKIAGGVKDLIADIGGGKSNDAGITAD
jgi:pilus assembly protein Flp/PilA